jgi:hypothetical protein
MAADQYIVSCLSGSTPTIGIFTPPAPAGLLGQTYFSCPQLGAAPDVLLTFGDYQGILLLMLGVVALAWGFRVLGSLIYKWH